MHYLQQPKKSSLCGQTCLAMITGKSIEEITPLVGAKGTSTKRILEVLTKFGYIHSGRLVPRRKQKLPRFAICKVRREWRKNGNWHWVVLANGKIYDPDPPTLDKTYDITPLAEYEAMNEKRQCKLTSFIAIDKEI